MLSHHPQFTAHCASLNDQELCDWLASAIEDMPVPLGGWPQRVVSYSWAFQGFSESAGLSGSVCSYYFEKRSLADVAEAYEFIGLPEKAELLWKLHEISLLAREADDRQPDEISLFQSDEDLICFMAQHISWDQSEQIIWEKPTDFVRRLATFIRANLYHSE